MSGITKVADVVGAAELGTSTEAAVATAVGLGWDYLGGSNDFVTSFWKCLVVILITEIGDKTFFIAAVLAMRNGRLIGIYFVINYIIKQ